MDLKVFRDGAVGVVEMSVVYSQNALTLASLFPFLHALRSCLPFYQKFEGRGKTISTYHWSKICNRSVIAIAGAQSR